MQFKNKVHAEHFRLFLTADLKLHISTVETKIIIFWGANRGFLGKWIEFLYISISKVKAGKKTK